MPSAFCNDEQSATADMREQEDGLQERSADQWANKTNQWNATTEKSEVINLQRQDDPTNHMH